MTRRSCSLVALACAVLLTGCVPQDHDDLRQWMSDLRATTKASVTPLDEPKQFQPELYNGAGKVEPFNPQRLTQALRRESAQSSAGNVSLITPEMSRRKEQLEAYPLDTMRMVGSLNKNGVPTALLSVDGLLYQVRVGNYLGQNYGKIVAIGETSLRLREIVQDPGGEWVERTTTLELQEGTERKK